MANFIKVESSKVAAYDQGLREYMIKVFNYMCIALAITGVVSYVVISTPLINLFFSHTPDGSYGLSGLGWLFMVAPLVFVFFFSYKIHSMDLSTAKMMLWVYSALMAVSLSPIFLMYTNESIARVFFITASVFAAMSIYGYTTKRDLSSWGSFLIMGLIGVVIASVVNIFMQSPAIQFVISIVSVLVFTGLTAYDVQKIVNIYESLPNSQVRDKAAVMGALSLYLDFINLFLSLLRIFGDRRN